MVTTRRMSAGGPVQTASPPQMTDSAGHNHVDATACTLDQVAQHDRPDDCWLVIRGKVYNVTDWVPRHPGGDMIFVKAGQDCTLLFDSYHPLSARRVLDKFYVGEVALQPGEQLQPAPYESDSEPGQFYGVLKQRVEKYFREEQINPREAAGMYVKSLVILLCLGVSFYGTFFGFQSVTLSAVCAAVLGLATAEVGVSIQHDANHGAYGRRGWWQQAMGASLDLVGASSFMWRQQHVVGHHVYTNVDGLDPDIRVKDPDVRRVTAYQPWQPYQAYQHVYLAVLYGLLAIKSVLLDDFVALSSRSIGSVRVARLTPGERAVFWGGKAFWAAVFLLLPMARSHHSWRHLATLWLLSQLITGWALALMFQVAHVTGDVAYYATPEGGRKLQRGWAAAQVASSADFSHGSWFWTHVSGGLNYQVVHHLFPGVCHLHYPAIAPIVLHTCTEFDVPYQVYPSFWSAVVAHFKHLHAMGNMGKPFKIPSLMTVG